MSLLEHFHKAVRRVLPSCGLAGSEEIGDRFGEIGLADLTKTPRTFTETVEKDHGRLEVRCCFAFDQLDALHKPEQWVSLGFFVVFESERTLKGKTTLEQRLYITSLPADAARISAAIRAHGSVENRLH